MNFRLVAISVMHFESNIGSVKSLREIHRVHKPITPLALKYVFLNT